MRPLPAILSACCLLLPATAHAAGASRDAAVAQIQQAIDEQRLLDAGRMLDSERLAGVSDPRLILLSADLSLARASYPAALAAYRSAEANPATRARALQGEGVALSLMDRSTEALAVLQKAVAEDPAAWRAWNALGSEHDRRAQWPEAETAYEHALASSDSTAIVLNNRGYSRLLQNRRAEAVADLVAALQKKPNLAEARTNLRLALAMGGDYDRAIAGGAPDDQAALLNNAGFAAGIRGDFAQAEDLLGRAMKIKSEYYGRAAENLKIVRALAMRSDPAAHAAP
jgi:Flp pilus assembly protein TadD